MAVSGMRAAFLLLYAGAACAAVDARGSLGTRPPPPHDLDCKIKALAYKCEFIGVATYSSPLRTYTHTERLRSATSTLEVALAHWL
eukprot:m.288903 g.288903  ORF g.288903 m.288903 type:complete len:86 (+) comp16220_c0_seq74:1552-1809(+)